MPLFLAISLLTLWLRRCFGCLWQHPVCRLLPGSIAWLVLTLLLSISVSGRDQSNHPWLYAYPAAHSKTTTTL